MSDVLVDSNVLLRLLAKADPKHTVADESVREVLEAGHRPCVAPQVVMESWVVLTRPVAVNGFGWRAEEARETLAGAMERFGFLEETPAVFPAWWKLAGGGVLGKRAHDARLVALMHVHEVPFMLTFNVADFAEFQGIAAFVPGGELPP